MMSDLSLGYLPHFPSQQNADYRIFIFNPETDYALAAARARYSPPARVVSLKKSLSLTPAIFAKRNDVIVIPESPGFEDIEDEMNKKIIREVNVEVVSENDLPQLVNDRLLSGLSPSFQPWGWNHSLRLQLISMGIDPAFLPSSEYIDKLRLLAHRRTALEANLMFKGILPELEIREAKEFCNVEDTMKFCGNGEDWYLKMPWSSSGRGVICSSSLSEKKLREWIVGCIRRQGSVMIEKGYRRTGDFATEWWVDGEGVHFMGLSMFHTSSEGRYLGNYGNSDQEISCALSSHSPSWNNGIVEAQKTVISKLIAPYYSGPVGIDMLTDKDGILVPIVEINLRFTMGLVDLYRRKREHSTFKIEENGNY